MPDSTGLKGGAQIKALRVSSAIFPDVFSFVLPLFGGKFVFLYKKTEIEKQGKKRLN